MSDGQKAAFTIDNQKLNDEKSYEFYYVGLNRYYTFILICQFLWKFN